jgi:hypothetical protein
MPRVLQGITIQDSGVESMFLNVDPNQALPQRAAYVSPAGSDVTGDGTQANPFATPGYAAGKLFLQNGSLDGTTIYMGEGDYIYNYQWVNSIDWPTSPNAWLTITSAPGASPDKVRFTTGTNPGFANLKVHLQNLTIKPASTDTMIFASNSGVLWFDQVRFVGPGAQFTHTNSYSLIPPFWTNSEVSETQMGYANSALIRNCTANNIGEDGYHGDQLVISSSVYNILFANPNYHPDVWQQFSFDPAQPFANYIIYGLTADHVYSQGLGPTNAKDLAIVNADINILTSNPDSIFQNFQGNGLLENIYILDSVFEGRSNWRTDLAGFNALDCVVQNTDFSPEINPANVTGVKYFP